MDCGRITASDADVFADDGAYAGQPKNLVVPCFLIRHPKGDLMWDTGVPQSLADVQGGVTEGPFHIVVARKLTDQLAQLGLQPSDIEFLSVSHSHFDHIGNGNLFAASTWIVDPEERAHAFRDAARADSREFAAYSALENAPTRLIEGDGDYDVFGDGSVVIIQAPGHTPGHTVLLVRLPEAGPLLLTGDLWHIAESRAARRVPRFNSDRAQTLQSMDKFERIASETGARVVIEHVPADFDALPRFPEPLRSWTWSRRSRSTQCRRRPVGRAAPAAHPVRMAATTCS
jgi:glyoxylase-like metal-dependent hydrolase (beta-lactamase superfamily II)